MSKSQRRKQRLLKKGAEIACGSQSKMVVTQVRSQPQSGKRRNRRRRARRAGSQGNSRTGDPYLNALLDPEHAEGCKIPDVIGYPTGTFQLEAHGILSTGAGGDSLGLSFEPIIGDGSTYFPIKAFNGTTTGSLAATANVSWGSRSSVSSLFQGFRPVSAEVKMSFIGPSTADGGRITGGCPFLGTTYTIGTTWTAWSDYPDMEIFPAKNGIRVLWKPLDNSNFEFEGVAGSFKYPTSLVAATGLPAATANMMYRIICNFEAIPKVDSVSLVETEPSPYNMDSIRAAFNWAQEAGNNVSEIVQKAGPYIQTAKTIYDAIQGGSPSSWPQLPQRTARKTRWRKSASSAAMVGSRFSREPVLDVSEGKSEDEDELEYENLNSNVKGMGIRSSGTPSQVGSRTPSLGRKGS